MSFSFKRPPGNLFSQLLIGIFSLLLLVLAVSFSLVVFAVLAVFGVGFWIYIWWKTRRLRQILATEAEWAKNNPPSESATAPNSLGDGVVIEGESVRVDTEK